MDYNDENQPKEKMISVQEPKEAVNNMELYDHSIKTEKGGGYKNDKIDDISFRIAKILSGDDEYEKAMNAVINILKENLEIDRLYIMECTDEGICVSACSSGYQYKKKNKEVLDYRYVYIINQMIWKSINTLILQEP